MTIDCTRCFNNQLSVENIAEALDDIVKNAEHKQLVKILYKRYNSTFEELASWFNLDDPSVLED